MLEPPTGGKIYFDGEEITRKGYPLEKMRRKMGMVFQSFNLFPQMTVLENVTFAPMKLLGLGEAQARIPSSHRRTDRPGVPGKSIVMKLKKRKIK